MPHCKVLLLLIIDECSLLDAYTFGSMENSVRQCAYSGRSLYKPWASLPVILMFGDNFQLPSVGVGVLDMMDSKLKKDSFLKIKNPVVAKLTLSGWKQYMLLSEQVLSLTISKRVDGSNVELLHILDALRGDDDTQKINEKQIQKLLDLNLNNNKSFTFGQQLEIKARSMCLFATKENRDLYNSEMLLKLNQKHPVCICSSVTTRNGQIVSLNSHYDSERVPSKTILIKEAMVQLTGWNAKPEWGLFHSSIGKIIDIVYQEGQSPNSGDFPSYVLVDFFHTKVLYLILSIQLMFH